MSHVMFDDGCPFAALALSRIIDVLENERACMIAVVCNVRCLAE